MSDKPYGDVADYDPSKWWSHRYPQNVPSVVEAQKQAAEAAKRRKRAAALVEGAGMPSAAIDFAENAIAKGDKQDAGKVAGFYLIPTLPLAELARVYKIGADKYEPRGWEKGMAWSRLWDAMARHQGAWLRGETHDPEDGQHHLASVAWAALALMEYERTHPELDDVHAADPHD